MGVSYRDIAILFPKWAGTGRINDALKKAGIPVFHTSTQPGVSAAFDLSENTVKVLTVHTAKGLEFPVVFLFGAEAVAVPTDFAKATEKEAHMARTIYVGMTRATDILYVTYTKLKGIVGQADLQKRWCEFKSYPDDFEF